MPQDVLDEYLNSIRDRENLNTEQPQAETSSSFSNYITSLETTEERPQGPSYSDPLVLDYADKLKKAPRSFLQGRTYTLDQLEKDPEFQVRADRFMESIDADEDIFEYLRDTDFSLSSAIVRSGQVKGWSEEAKEDYNYLRDKFDNAEIGSTQQFLRLAGDMTVDLIADPINWLAALFFIPSGGQSATATAAGTVAAKEVVKKGLSKIAKKELKESTKEGLEYTKKTAILGAVEGGAWTGAHDYFLQNTDIELGLRDEVDWSQVGITTGLGVGLGGVFGGSIGALTSISPALSKKIFKYSNEGDIIKSDQTISKQLEFEGFGDDKAVDEVFIKDSTKVDKRPIIDKDKKQKRLRKRKQIIANTFGKVTTQFVEMAENSPQMQKLLGRFRYDWARTFTTGVRGVEAESYGLSLSERTQGYLFNMRKALNPLLRDKGWFKNTLRKDQNDNLVYLLRLEKKEFENLVESGKANIAGREVVTAAKEIRKLLNEMFEEGVETGLMTRSQFVDHFFPRHFQHSKILADKPKFTKIIADSEHSIPQNVYSEDSFVKITKDDIITKERKADAKWVDAEVFNRNFVDEASNGRTSIWDELTPAEQLEARTLKAEKIVEDMLDMKYSPFQFGTKNNAGAGHSFLQHRVFNKIDDTDLVDFLENNVEDVLEQYITDASRAITRTKFFGKTQADYEKNWLIPISKELRKEGVDSDQIAETLRRLRLMHSRVTGLDTDKIRVKNKVGAYGLDALKLSQQMAHLPFATVSSLTEPLILLTRIDSVGGKLDATKQVGKALVKGIKKDWDKFIHYSKRVSGKEVRGYADMSDEYWHEAYKVGLAMEQAVMHRIESLTGEALTSPLAKRFQNAFFKANFLSSWTGAVQLASFTTGKRLIRENTEQLINGKTLLGRKLSDSKRKYLTKQLNELGIDEKEAKEWYKNSLDKNGVFDEGRAMGTSSDPDFMYPNPDKEGNKVLKTKAKKQIFFYKNRYQSGANRFTREIILNPSTAEANRPLWFSHPAGQLLAQFAGYPTVFNNTILKRWINEGLIENKRQTSAKIAGTALAMTAIATFTNAVRSGGRSLEEEDGTIITEAIQRWGGLGPGDYAYRFYQNANTGSGQAGALLKTPSGPIVSDVFDAVLYRKGFFESLTANVPFYSALPKDIRDSMKKSGRSVDKALWGSMFPQTGKKKKVVGRGSPGRDVSYAKGGIVLNVPNVSREPDEKKVRGLPLTYAELGGVLAQDVEDRKGFVKGGIVNRISQEAVNDEVIRHLTKEVRKAEPIYESTTTTSLYKKAEADEFAKNVDKEAIRYVNSDRLNELEEELRYSTELGVKVTTKSKSSGGKKIKYKGRLRLVRPLELGDVSPEDLTGSNFVEAIQTNSALRNNIINNSPLPKEDATKLVKTLVDDYNDTQKLVRGYSEQPIEVTQPLLDIKQSIKARETLTDLGYDSIRYNDSEYILFDNNQFRVNKKLRLRKGFAEGGRIQARFGDRIRKRLKDRRMDEESWYPGKRIKDMTPAHAEVWLKKVLFGDREPITEKVFSPEEYGRVTEGIKREVLQNLDKSNYRDNIAATFFDTQGRLRDRYGQDYDWGKMGPKGSHEPYFGYMGELPREIHYILGSARYNLKKGEYNTEKLTIDSDQYDFGERHIGYLTGSGKTEPGLNIDNLRQYYKLLKSKQFKRAAERFANRELPDQETVDRWKRDYGIEREAEFVPVNMTFPVSDIFSEDEWAKLQRIEEEDGNTI